MVKSKRSPKKKKIAPESYTTRSYRQVIDPGALVSTFITVQQTDLHILAPSDVKTLALDSVYRYRNQLENYIALQPQFLTSLVPLPFDSLALPLVREMLRAAMAAAVGPMAAVAGTIAEFVGKDILAAGASEVVVENGGDIFLCRTAECVASIFAGQSPLTGKIGLRIPAARMPVGLCTSSGTVGHSLSLGKADAVTVLAASTPLADAAATRLGNEVSGPQDINRALQVAKTIPGLFGVVIVLGRQLGAWGEVELISAPSAPSPGY